MGNPGAANALP